MRVQRQLSETFIQEVLENENDRSSTTHLDLENHNVAIRLFKDNSLDVSAIANMRPSYLGDKSGLLADTSMIMNNPAIDNQIFQNEGQDDKDSSFLLISPPTSAEEKIGSMASHPQAVRISKELDISKIEEEANQ